MAELLNPSLAVTVITLLPWFRGTEADHDAVPDAVPLPPVAAFDQVTLVTLTLSEAVPPRASTDEDVLQVGAVVGPVMATPGPALSMRTSALRVASTLPT